MPKRDYLDDPQAPKPNSLVVAVGAVIRNPTGEILLIKRGDNGLWALPGGAQDLAWTPPERLPELEIHPSMRFRVEHGLAYASVPYLS